MVVQRLVAAGIWVLVMAELEVPPCHMVVVASIQWLCVADKKSNSWYPEAGGSIWMLVTVELEILSCFKVQWHH